MKKKRLTEVDGQLRHALRDLKKCHSDVRAEFSKLDGSVYRQYLGALDSRLREQVREFCDGHVLYSLPKTVRDMRSVDAMVLFAVTSPKLTESSNFDPFTALHEISYWRDGKGLSQYVDSTSGRRYKLHYMAWQQNFSIHGIDDAHARRNLKLLVRERPELAELFQREYDSSKGFVENYTDWLLANRKPVFLVTQFNRTAFEEPISVLIDNAAVVHIRANLRGSNRTIMRCIVSHLP